MNYEGRTYDTGSKLGFLMANVAYALEREDLAPAFRAELEAFLAALMPGWIRRGDLDREGGITPGTSTRRPRLQEIVLNGPPWRSRHPESARLADPGRSPRPSAPWRPSGTA